MPKIDRSKWDSELANRKYKIRKIFFGDVYAPSLNNGDSLQKLLDYYTPFQEKSVDSYRIEVPDYVIHEARAYFEGMKAFAISTKWIKALPGYNAYDNEHIYSTSYYNFKTAFGALGAIGQAFDMVQDITKYDWFMGTNRHSYYMSMGERWRLGNIIKYERTYYEQVENACYYLGKIGEAFTSTKDGRFSSATVDSLETEMEILTNYDTEAMTKQRKKVFDFLSELVINNVSTVRLDEQIVYDRVMNGRMLFSSFSWCKPEIMVVEDSTAKRFRLLELDDTVKSQVPIEEDDAVCKRFRLLEI